MYLKFIIPLQWVYFLQPMKWCCHRASPCTNSAGTAWVFLCEAGSQAWQDPEPDDIFSGNFTAASNLAVCPSVAVFNTWSPIKPVPGVPSWGPVSAREMQSTQFRSSQYKGHHWQMWTCCLRLNWQVFYHLSLAIEDTILCLCWCIAIIPTIKH